MLPRPSKVRFVIDQNRCQIEVSKMAFRNRLFEPKTTNGIVRNLTSQKWQKRTVFSNSECEVTPRIKTVRAGKLDCPQDNQAQQASTDFRFKTGLSIVFICCCKIVPPARVSRFACKSAAFVFKVLISYLSKMAFLRALIFAVQVRESVIIFF